MNVDESYINSLVRRDTAQKVKWEKSNFICRICPSCGHTSYYCSTKASEPLRQPDNFCSKCGQRFVVE